MGLRISHPIPDEVMEDYLMLTYLHKGEILKIFKRFNEYYPEIMRSKPFHRFHPDEIILMFPEFKVNPFWNQLVNIFSSEKDQLLNFEDMLDMLSAFSSNCPENVKAAWAFKMFDFDNDGILGSDDIMRTIQAITGQYEIDYMKKQYIANEILNGMDLAQTGGVSGLEFHHALIKMPEFVTCFQLTI